MMQAKLQLWHVQYSEYCARVHSISNLISVKLTESLCVVISFMFLVWRCVCLCRCIFSHLIQQIQMNGTPFFHTYKVTLCSQTKWRKKSGSYIWHTKYLGNVCFYCYLINNVYNLTVYWSLLMQNMVQFFFFALFCFFFSSNARCRSQCWAVDQTSGARALKWSTRVYR